MKVNVLFVTVLLLLLLAAATAHAQVGVGTTTPDAKAALDIQAADKGLLIPRLTQAQRLAISSVPQGLMVYQTDAPEGFYYFGGTGRAARWVFLSPSGGADDLGNHTATQNLNLTDKLLVGGSAAAPGTAGLALNGAGNAGLGTAPAPAGSGSDRLRLDGGNLRLGLAGWQSSTDDRLLRFGDDDFVTLGEAGGDDVLQFRARDFRFNGSGTSNGGFAGRVGMGLGPTVAPTEQLQVGGNVKITGPAATTGLIFADGTKQTTAATGGGGLVLPYAGTATVAGAAFSVTNTNSGAAAIGVLGLTSAGIGVRGEAASTGGTGVRGVAFGSTGSAVEGIGQNGSTGILGTVGGTGRAGYFIQYTTTSSTPAVEIEQRGTGPALLIGSPNRPAEINSSATGPANLLPLAYGRVGRTGAVLSGTGNFTAKQDIDGLGVYTITITNSGGTNLTNAICLVTPSFGKPTNVDQIFTASAKGELNGKITVYTTALDAPTNPEEQEFSFVVYLP